MAVRLVLHILLCVTLIVATPIAQFGMTIKTILTLLFKVNNVFFMVKLKSAKNISGNLFRKHAKPMIIIFLAQTYLLSMSGNLLIMSLNFYQKNLFQIYLNCIINLSMDILIIILSRIYVSKKAD